MSDSGLVQALTRATRRNGNVVEGSFRFRVQQANRVAVSLNSCHLRLEQRLKPGKSVWGSWRSRESRGLLTQEGWEYGKKGEELGGVLESSCLELGAGSRGRRGWDGPWERAVLWTWGGEGTHRPCPGCGSSSRRGAQPMVLTAASATILPLHCVLNLAMGGSPRGCGIVTLFRLGT